MSRLMSVTLTEDAVRDRTKRVTRRLGWAFLRPGDTLTLCRKVMGRKRRDGTVEPLVRLAEVRVVSVTCEPLHDMAEGDVELEGFDPTEWDAASFVEWFCGQMRCEPWTLVNRIEWEYL